MPALKFLNPVFHTGINVTVRDGRKWDEAVTSLPTTVPIEDTARPGVVLGEAKIVGKMVLAAVDIPYGVLLQEHSPACRIYGGLREAMRAAYGSGWDGDREVTVLFFTVSPGELATEGRG